MWVLGTPPFKASKQHSIFGIIPLEITPVAIIDGIASRAIRLIRESGSFTSRNTPGTFVNWTNFSAFRATAIFAAAVSALIL